MHTLNKIPPKKKRIKGKKHEQKKNKDEKRFQEIDHV